MPNEEKMSMGERWEYLGLMKNRYVEAHRVERGSLLDEMEAVTAMYPRSLIRRMSAILERRPRRKQRGRTYDPEVEDALQLISESFNSIYAEHLLPNMVKWRSSHLS